MMGTPNFKKRPHRPPKHNYLKKVEALIRQGALAQPQGSVGHIHIDHEPDCSLFDKAGAPVKGRYCDCNPDIRLEIASN